MQKHISNIWILLLSLTLLGGCAELELASHMAKQSPIPASSKSKGTFKVGNPYKIAGKTYYPRETYNFEQTGIASWYGPNFHGKQTANGETFDMYELTAAHKTLQMPSLVRVTNLENGRSIVVRINDRGPFSKGRIIDLSKRGAELLGFKNQGTAKVKLQLLSRESRQIAEVARRGQSTRGMEVAMNQRGYRPVSHRPAPTRPKPAVSKNAPVPTVEVAGIQSSVPGHVSQGRFYPDPVVQQVPVQPTSIFVQAGSFGNSENAQRFASSLRTVGNAHVQPALVKGRNFYRVRIGPLDSVPEADGVLTRLSSIGQHDAIVVVD